MDVIHLSCRRCWKDGVFGGGGPDPSGWREGESVCCVVEEGDPEEGEGCAIVHGFCFVDGCEDSQDTNLPYEMILTVGRGASAVGLDIEAAGFDTVPTCRSNYCLVAI